MSDPKSLTSLAVACLEQASRPAEEWADRATAQRLYAQLLQHPSLQDDPLVGAKPKESVSKF